MKSNIVDNSRVGPFKKALPNPKSFDYAFAWEVTLQGEPKPTDEAREHRWVTLDALSAETEIRLPGIYGINGRMAQMINAILDSDAFGYRPHRRKRKTQRS